MRLEKKKILLQKVNCQLHRAKLEGRSELLAEKNRLNRMASQRPGAARVESAKRKNGRTSRQALIRPVHYRTVVGILALIVTTF